MFWELMTTGCCRKILGLPNSPDFCSSFRSISSLIYWDIKCPPARRCYTSGRTDTLNVYCLFV